MASAGSQQVIKIIFIIHISDQNGELEKRSNNFLLRNFFDRVRDIAEQNYKGKWIDPLHAGSIGRKWSSFPISTSKVIILIPDLIFHIILDGSQLGKI